MLDASLGHGKGLASNCQGTVMLTDEFVADTKKLTTPLPIPLPPDVMAINEELLTAVHAQPAWVVTVTLPVPPVDGKV